MEAIAGAAAILLLCLVVWMYRTAVRADRAGEQRLVEYMQDAGCSDFQSCQQLRHFGWPESSIKAWCIQSLTRYYPPGCEDE